MLLTFFNPPGSEIAHVRALFIVGHFRPSACPPGNRRMYPLLFRWRRWTFTERKKPDCPFALHLQLIAVCYPFSRCMCRQLWGGQRFSLMRAVLNAINLPRPASVGTQLRKSCFVGQWSVPVNLIVFVGQVLLSRWGPILRPKLWKCVYFGGIVVNYIDYHYLFVISFPNCNKSHFIGFAKNYSSQQALYYKSSTTLKANLIKNKMFNNKCNTKERNWP